LALTMHAGCRAQLDPGDLGKLFDGLERGLALPLAVLELSSTQRSVVGVEGWKP
jgi:hypothetical protein